MSPRLQASAPWHGVTIFLLLCAVASLGFILEWHTSSTASLRPSLDIDQNGQATASQDGMVIMRYLQGRADASLTAGVVDPAGTRTSPDEIIAYLEPLRHTMLDVDGNGEALPHQDGQVILRYLFGIRGPSLIAGIVDEINGIRITVDEIETYLAGFMPGANQTPDADSGPDQTVPVGATAQLNGAGSTDGDGDQLTYAWLVTNQPDGSGATVANPTSVLPTFTPDLDGDYTIQLIVNDGQVDSQPSTVTISTTNSKPVADPGPDRQVSVNVIMPLDASGSTDVDGNPLTYQWALLDKPAGSLATLSETTAIQPTLEPDIEGPYKVQLIVGDGTVDSEPAIVTLTTVNIIPVAHAGRDQAVTISQPVVLDGHRSYDANGDLLTFHWALLSMPVGSNAVLSDLTSVHPSFTPDLAGTYVVQLLVDDGSGECKPDTVVINTSNVAPYADAGNDQVISQGETATLNGSGSTDLNGDELSFNWAILSKPNGSVATLSDATTITPTLDIDVAGLYIAQLIVHDGQQTSVPDTVVLTDGNVAPVADAGADQTVIQGATAFLDSTESNDANDDNLTQQWALVAKPDASTTTLLDPQTEMPSFEADAPGTYVADVQVHDPSGAGDRDASVIRTDNSQPVADAGPDQTVLIGSTVTLQGNNSDDADNDSLTFLWALTVKPDGSSANLSSPTSTTPEFVADVAGAYLAQLIVNDGQRSSEPDTVLIETLAEPEPPVITDFNPKMVSHGEQVIIIGENLVPLGGGATEVTLAKQGGGTIPAPVTSAEATSVAFTVPTGADTGQITATVSGESATSALELIIKPSNTISALKVDPDTADLIQGQSVSYAVTLESQDGFSQLAALDLTGLPSGITYEFDPPQIAEGQTSILSLTAPGDQQLDTHELTVTASATVDGFDVEQAGMAEVEIKPVTTTFMGRTVVADTLQTPLAGVTVTMLGKDDTGAQTGCTGQTVSDLAGNFTLSNLSLDCVGKQLIRYDGSTAIAPAGKYAGVDLIYTLQQDQVTVSPVLVHLPRIDNAETVCVIQNAGVDQDFIFQTIPNLSITVYAGTTFTPGPAPLPQVCPIGQFPLTAVEVPVDRLPEEMPPSTDTIEPFIVAFQPANAMASMPVAVSFPNTLNVPPGTSMELSTLDPTLGVMVVYGVGTVSNDGLQIVPDFNPATPGKRYGLVHFDWHGPRNPPNNQENPNPECGDKNPSTKKPVDLSSGIEVIRNTDISINGSRGGISIQRIYRTLSLEPGPFGIGSNHNFGFRLNTNSPQAAALINLVMPDGNRFPFASTAPGNFTNTTICKLRGAVLLVAGNGESDLRLKNGTVYHFVPSTALLGSILETITDTNGNVITLARNPNNTAQITEIVDPVGRKLTLSYDGANRITLVTDPLGRRVKYTYNSLGTLETVTDPIGGITRYEYSAANRLTQVTDARGVVDVQNAYNADGRVIQQTYADGGVLNITYTLANPELGVASPVLTTVVTDPLGNQTMYRFNPLGYVLDVTDPLGQVRIFEREPGTNLLLALRGSGQCDVCGDSSAGDVNFSYDLNGNQLTRTDALGNTTTFTYDPVFNQLTSVTDPLSQTTSFTYDGSGNLLSVTDGRNNTTKYTYDSNGLLLTVTDALLAQRSMDYDVFGNLISITDPQTNVTKIQYDLISRPTKIIDALGRQTIVSYDPLDRTQAITDAKGNTTRVTYDAISNFLSITDARNNTTSFAYDAAGRLQTQTDSLGKTETRLYDLNDNLTSFTDRRSQTSTFTYDVLKRLVHEVYADGSSVARVFDSHGRLIQATESISGTFTKTYDLTGRLLSESGPHGTVTYIPDALGRVSRRQVVGQSPVNYTYDSAGNQKSVSSPSASITYTYDNRNQVINESRINGVESNYTYDTLGRVLTIIHTNSLTTLDSLSFVYDAVGNIIQRTADVAQPLTTQSSLNTYDPLSNRLTQWGSKTYTHDNNGNRLTETGPSGTTTYTWDSRNRLQMLAQPTGEIKTFTYDFAGNLIEEKTSGTVTPTSRTYVVDDLANVVQLTDNPGKQLSILTGQTIDQHLAVTARNGTSNYGLANQINSSTVIVDDAGNSQGQILYEPFGKTTTVGSDYPFQFTGRVPVGGGLYHYRARYYDSSVGRFISEDPIGFLDGLNFYAYVGGNPVIHVDPLGLLKGETPIDMSGECIDDDFLPGGKCYKPPPKRKKKRDCEKEGQKAFNKCVDELADFGDLCQAVFGNKKPDAKFGICLIRETDVKASCAIDNIKNGY